MNCPYCGRPMQEGTLIGGTKSTLRFQTAEQMAKGGTERFMDYLGGKGFLKAQKDFSNYRIPAVFCPNCKKMIIDTDVQK